MLLNKCNLIFIHSIFTPTYNDTYTHKMTHTHAHTNTHIDTNTNHDTYIYDTYTLPHTSKH